MREVGVSHHCADSQTAVGKRSDLVERQARDVDELRWLFDVELHQVDERRPSGEIASPRIRDREACRGVRVGDGRVGERLHRATPRARESRARPESRR